jgi:hypothetical protein
MWTKQIFGKYCDGLLSSSSRNRRFCLLKNKNNVEFSASISREIAGENYFITCGDILKKAVETSTRFVPLLFGSIRSSIAE